ncbi:hypothetical protein FT663_03996 [Candidozyma haemuli var. vulneris]|uniref:AAA+ ATPase domain-containing protein n=1 Tax=Candidozyma haemuli TaxID=45357 RepID=A0A2V1AUS9_9ASCO|nr:hypothetical protein CXQ85_000557 [[Candida] haemuloni]KAF3986361.1 hypothetical protein FT662_04614 [[Candida] haemuloni var. vulneris]KAF3988527.1 hypothetical protein FT663_03996 [[Candida] haemuloni var. vulneris]PVH21575.1 hypothetical protein CXQ85_000557 [[Candida] haemuloni]
MSHNSSTIKETLRQPLSELIRPTSLESVIGQKHLINSTNGAITNFITLGYLPSMILYGPPGVGKTTLAKLLAEKTNYVFVELSATDATVAELRDLSQAIQSENLSRSRLGQERLRVAVFIDEIHRFTVIQQDFLLPFVESGAFVFLAATTVSPGKRIRKAIISRCQLFELQKLNDDEIRTVVEKAMVFQNIRRRILSSLQPIVFEDGASEVIASYAHGDSRTAINFVELIGSNTRFSEEASHLTKDQTEDFVRKLTKVRFGLQNESSLGLLDQLYDFMNQKAPSEVEMTSKAPKLVSYDHDETSARLLVTINVKAATAAASDLESCYDEDIDERFSDDESSQKGAIYSDDDDEEHFITNRLSRSKYFVRAAAHTMLQLLSRGESVQLITKYLLLYVSTYVDLGSSLLIHVMALHKSLQKATIDTPAALTNCIQELTTAPKHDGELISKTLGDLKAFFASTLKVSSEPKEVAFTVVEDDSLVDELLTEPPSMSQITPPKASSVDFNFEEAFYTLGNDGMSLLDEN